jgi:hypothetical protein
MKLFPYIASRIVLLLVVLITGALIHEHFFYPEIKKKEGWLQHLAESQLNKKPQVLYLSSSPNKAIAPDDADRRFISQMMQDSIDLHLEVIDTGAVHAGIFYSILKKIPKDQLPELIVLNLNIRSHGANWIHSGLENSLQRNFVYWNKNPGMINHLVASVKWYEYKSPMEHNRAIEYGEKFLHLPYKNSHQTIKKWCDSLFNASENPDEGMTMIRNFAFSIDENNVQLKRFDKIAIWAKEHDIPLIFVILPENVERMKRLVGPNLSDLVKRNASFLEERYVKRGVHVLNLYNRAPESVFFEGFPTEHYRALGRATVANEVAKEIKKIQQK